MEWVTTTQGIVAIIASLVTLVFGGGSLVAVTKGAMRSNQPAPTANQVMSALLASSDLANLPGIGSPSNSFNPATPTTASCNKVNITLPQPMLKEERDFDYIEPPMEIDERISTYNSSSDAHKKVAAVLKEISCFYNGMRLTLTNFSSKFSGLCNENESWIIDSSAIQLMASATIRCGNNVLEVWVIPSTQYPIGQSEPDLSGMLYYAVEGAVAKFELLPGS